MKSLFLNPNSSICSVKPRRTRKGQQEASKLHRPKQHQFPNKIRERVNLGLESSSPAGNTKNKRSHIPKALVQFNDAPRGVARSKEQIKYSRVQTNDYQDGMHCMNLYFTFLILCEQIPLLLVTLYCVTKLHDSHKHNLT